VEQKEFNQIFKDYVGVCYWTKSAIQGEGTCYKHAFYGIRSHQCLELTPIPDACNLDCAFCWRNLDKPGGNAQGLALTKVEGYVDKLIALRNQKISGFGNQALLDPQVREQSTTPKFWTISYSGEPTLSPELPRLVSDLLDRGFKTLVVSNGTRPEALETLAPRPPTQLYLSLCGYDEASFERISSPKEKGLWGNVGLSIKALKSIKCRRAFRITLLKGFNLDQAKAFADLVKEGLPEYVEMKAYAHMGQSINRLPFSAVPGFEQVQSLGRELALKTGYLYAVEQERGGAVLLCRDQDALHQRLLA
jgi:tRNA wybutosine-synthesizing protein 1